MIGYQARNATITPPGGGAITFNTDAAAALILAGYLIAVLWRGNLGQLAAELRRDFFGSYGTQTNAQPGDTVITAKGPQQPAFWRWAIAVLILMALASNPKTRPAFGPILAISIVGMLINVAGSKPEVFKQLTEGVSELFGFDTRAYGATVQGNNPDVTGRAAAQSSGAWLMDALRLPSASVQPVNPAGMVPAALMRGQPGAAPINTMAGTGGSNQTTLYPSGYPTGYMDNAGTWS